MLPVSDFKIQKKSTFRLTGQIKLKLLVSIAAVVFLLFVSQLVFAASLATDGEKLSEIEKEIQILKTENINLKVEIAASSSLLSLSENARELGFVKSPQVITP